MPRRINTVGGGNKTNVNGLAFEQQTTLEDALLEAGFELDENDIIYLGNESIGQLVQKNKFYKNFLEPNGVNYKDIISKRLLPDDCFVNFRNNTVYVIEKKFQHSAGSVDEKLQTCDFKRKQYLKLVSEINFNIEYIYLLCDWFKRDEYRDVLEYIKEVGCDYHFNEIPLSILNIEDKE